MTDPRLEKLARVLVDYSLAVKRGQKLNVSSSTGQWAVALVQAVYRRAIRRGALVTAGLAVPGLSEILLKEGSRKQLKFLPPEQVFKARQYDAHLMLRSPENTRELSGCDPQKQSILARARKPWQ